MKKQNLTGIAAITSFATLVILLFIINAQAELVKAIYVKLAMINLAFMIIAAGVYLMDVYCKETNRTLKISVASYGALLAVLSIFICFDVISFLRSWNWLISGGILFILLIQLQLLNWGKWNLNIVRFSTLFIILADLFLICFFIAKWRIAELGLWINLAAIISIVLTATSMYFLKREKLSFLYKTLIILNSANLAIVINASKNTQRNSSRSVATKKRMVFTTMNAEESRCTLVNHFTEFALPIVNAIPCRFARLSTKLCRNDIRS